MFEIHVGELRATFLRNHNMRRHKDPSRRHPKPGRQPKRKTTQAQKTRQPPQPPQARGHCTRYVAVHPLRGGAPVTWRCTRTEEVHCLRIGCSAPTNKNKRGTDTTHPLPAAPLHAQLGPTGGRTGTPPTRPTPPTLPTPPPALRPTPAQSDTSYTLTCEEPINPADRAASQRQ